MRTLKNGELNSGELVLHFSGAENEVDARSLGEIIVHISSIICRINHKIDPNSEIRIVVTSFETGSFRVVIEYIYRYTRENAKEIINALIAVAILEAAGSSLDVVKSTVDNIMEEEIQKRTTMLPGFKNYIDQISSDELIHRDIYRIAKVVYYNRLMDDLAIFLSSRDSNPIVIFSESSCQKIIEKYNMKMKTQSKSYLSVETIEICSAIFDQSKSKWRFDLNGIKISARILDQEFLKLVRSGQISIKAGERIHAKIKVTEKRYVISGDLKSKEYEIERVLDLLNH